MERLRFLLKQQSYLLLGIIVRNKLWAQWNSIVNKHLYMVKIVDKQNLLNAFPFISIQNFV